MRSAPPSRILCSPLIVVLLLCAADVPTSPPATPSTQPAASHPATAQAPSYHWRHMNDAVGGPCSGLVFTSQDAAIRYCYGDTGGYRWDTLQQRWTSFTDWNPDPEYGHVAGLAIDPVDRNVMYYAAGTTHGEVFKSIDRGRTFVATGLREQNVSLVRPTDGATTGERIIVDSINPKVVYLASRLSGLWVSEDAAAPGSWKQVKSFTARGDVQLLRNAHGDVSHQPVPNGGLSFVAIDRRGGVIEVDGVHRSKTIFVGVIGDQWTDRADAPERIPESGVWRSNDGGQSWTRLAGPKEVDLSPTRAQIAADGDLWVTISGRVINIPRGGGASVVLGVPPGRAPIVAMAVDRLDPDHAVVARYGDSANAPYGEENRLFRTVDGGTTWKELKCEAATPAWWGKFATRTAVLRFEPNSPKDEHGRTKTLWLGDALGPWVCDDLDADVTHWRLISRGRGGDFVPALATPPAVPGRITAPLLAADRSFGGFRYLNVTANPERSFAGGSPAAHRQSTGSLSFCETDPRFIAAAADRSNGGGDGAIGMLSRDNGITWSVLHDAAAPGAGPIAVGSGLQAGESPVLVRWPARKPPRYSRDGGKTWLDGAGAPAAGESPPMQRLAADPTDGERFYLLQDDAPPRQTPTVFVSRDGGKTWQPTVASAATGPSSAATRRSAADRLQLAVVPGKGDELWIARSLAADSVAREAATPTATHPASQPAPDRPALLRSIDGGKTWAAIVGWEEVYCVAFGASADGQKSPSVVVSGVLRGKQGIYLCDSTDAAAGAEVNWRLIWDPQNTDTPAIQHCLWTVVADRQAFGRVYVGATTAPRGIFYGEPVPQAAPASPTNVTATIGKSGVAVQWTDPVGAAEYDVQRAEPAQPNQWTTVVTSAWQARVVDTSAKPATAYLYRVIASNALGRSEPSVAVRAE